MADQPTLAPYKGLVPYAEEDALFFFGRKAESKIVSANLIARRLTVLYAESGVGKSSILQAGVAHHLRAEAKRTFAERGTPEFVVVVFSSWRDDPVSGLVGCIRDAVERSLGPTAVESVGKNLSLLDSLIAFSESANCEILVILDQFEEYFLYHPHEEGECTFAVGFPRAVNHSALRANFLIAIREDSLAKLDRFKGKIPSLFENYLRIERLDRDAAQAAVEGPIAEYNRQLPSTEEPIRIEPELVRSVLAEVRSGRVSFRDTGRGAPGETQQPDDRRSRIEAPYLQLVMSRLWEEEQQADSSILHHKTLQRLGGAEKVVRTHLDSALSFLPESDQDAAANIFHHLVTPSGTKIAHTALDLSGYSGLPVDRLVPLLEKLSGSEVRILRPVAPPPKQPTRPRYQIFHDVLAAAVLDWQQRYFRRREREEEARQAEQLRRQAEEEARSEERQRYAKRRRWMAVALSLALVGLAVITGIAWMLQRHAQQLEQAHESTAAAISRGLAAESLRSKDQDSELSTLLALEALATARAQGMTPPAEVKQALQNTLGEVAVERSWRGHPGAVRAVSFDPTGQYVATAGEDHVVRVWDLRNDSDALELPGHSDTVYALSFHPSGGHLATGAGDGIVRLWDLESAEPTQQLRPTSEQRLGIELASASIDAKSPTSTAEQPEEEPPPGEAGAVAEPGTDDEAPTAEEESEPEQAARIRRIFPQSPADKAGLQAGDRVAGFAGQEVDGPKALRKRIAETESGTVEIRVIRDSRPLNLQLDLGPSLPPVRGVAFGPDGRHLAVVDESGLLAVWDASAQRIRALARHDASLHAVAFSADGKRLATVGEDGHVVTWRLDEIADSMAPQRDLDLELTGSFLGIAFGALAEEEADRLGLGQGEGVLISGVEEGEAAEAAGVLAGDILVEFAGEPARSDALSLRIRSLAVGTRVDLRILRRTDDPEPSSNEDSLQSVHLQALLGEGPLPAHGVAFSPDGRFLATVDEAGMAQIWDAQTGNFLRKIESHDGAALGIAFDPTGRWLATTGSDGLSNLWDTKSGQLRKSFESPASEIHSLAFSSDGEHLAVGATDGTARIWNVANGEMRTLRAHHREIWSATFSPDGISIATAGYDSVARIWNPTTGKEEVALVGHLARLYEVAFSRDSQRVATASYDNTARIWDVASGEEQLVLGGHGNTVLGAAWNDDGSLIATASVDHKARVWDAKTGALLHILTGHEGWVWDIAFTPDGTKLATASSDCNVILWDPASGDQLRVLEHPKPVVAISFSPDGKYLATGGNKDIKVWGLESSEQPKSIPRQDGWVSDVSFSPDGQRLASAVGEAVKILNPMEGTELASFTGHTDGVLSVDWSPDGFQLVTSSKDGSARIWNALLSETEEVNGVDFNPDGSRLAEVRNGAVVRVWDIASEQPLLAFSGHTGNVLTVDFSNDGKLIATASTDGDIKVWNSRTGLEYFSRALEANFAHAVDLDPAGSRIAVADTAGLTHIWALDLGTSGKEDSAHPTDVLLEGHEDDVWDVVFSPDGKSIATASDDGTARIWDSESGAMHHVLDGHDDSVYAVSWSPDGSTVASGGKDATVRFWDATTGQAKGYVLLHDNSVSNIRFGPRGVELITSSLDRSARVWRLEDGVELESFEFHRAGLDDVAVSSSGRLLATASRSGRVRILPRDDDGLLLKAYETLTRTLSRSECQRYTPHEPMCSDNAASVGLVVRARNQAAAGDAPLAAQTLERALELNPDLGLAPERAAARWAANAQIAKGRLYLRATQFEMAIQAFAKALGLDHEVILDVDAEWAYSAPVLVERAEALAREGRRTEAIDLLEALDSRVDDAPGLQQLGMLYKAEGRFERALEALTRASRLDHSPWLKLQLAGAHYQAGNRVEAREITEPFRDTAENRYWLGQVLSDWEVYEEAISIFEELVEQLPTSTDIRFQLAAAYERSGRRDQGAREFEALLDLDGDHAPSLNYLGYMWAEDGINLQRAVNMIQRALEIAPETGAYIDSLGWAYFRLGRLDDARRELERATHFIPADPDLNEHLGDLYRVLKEFEKSRRSYEQAMKFGGEEVAERVMEKLQSLD